MPATAPHIRQCSSRRTVGRRRAPLGSDEKGRTPAQLIEALGSPQGGLATGRGGRGSKQTQFWLAPVQLSAAYRRDARIMRRNQECKTSVAPQARWSPSGELELCLASAR